MIIIGTVENHGKNGKKNTANFRENHKNHGKNTASNTDPKTIIYVQSIKFNV